MEKQGASKKAEAKAAADKEAAKEAAKAKAKADQKVRNHPNFTMRRLRINAEPPNLDHYVSHMYPQFSC
jgi:hypothetical protein